jgi:hypothetical protein
MSASPPRRITIDRLRDLTEARTGSTRSHRGKDGFQAHCPGPCHRGSDRHGSLSVDAGEKGIVLKCFVGCTVEDICRELGIEQRALFYDGRGEGDRIPPRKRAQAHTPPPPPSPPQAKSDEEREAPEGCTLSAYAVAKRLPPSTLRTFGLSEITYQNAPAVRIPYRDRAGVDRSVRFRIELAKRRDGTDNRFRWKSDSRVQLYGLWRLEAERAKQQEEGQQDATITLDEGESDCHTLWFHGSPAVGIPGATNWDEQRDAPELDGFDTIYVVVEPDMGGEAVKNWLTSSRIRDRVRLITLGSGHKGPERPLPRGPRPLHGALAGQP